MGEEGEVEYHVKLEGEEDRASLKNDYFLLSPNQENLNVACGASGRLLERRS